MKKIVFGIVIIATFGFGATMEERFNKCVNGDISECKAIVNKLPSVESCVKECENGILQCCDIGVLVYMQLNNEKWVEYFRKSVSLGNHRPYLVFWNWNYYDGNSDFAPIMEKDCNTPNSKNMQKTACFVLGKAYLKGRGVFGAGKGVVQNYQKALSAFERSCAVDFADSCVLAGYLYFRGKGTRQSTVKAKELYGKACDLGHQGACNLYNGM
ncbi:tetratricopeptide repeat protein [Helicobacter sp. 23-1044]